MSNWATLTEARSLWADAPDEDEVLDLALDAAQEQCEAFAPALGEGAPVPAGYTLAVVTQARSVYRASALANQDGGIGPDGLVIRTFPLDWQVRQLLRPARRGAGLIR